MARTPLEPQDRRGTEHVRPAADRPVGAHGATGEPHRRRRLGWLWLLLGLLALAGIIALLATVLGGDDDGGSVGQTQQQPGTTGGGGASEGGQLTAGGSALLPVPSGGFGEYVGQDARGEDVRVLSVVSNGEDPQALEGFWVGTSEQDRAYVEWGGDVGADEADFRPQEGDQVSFTGPVRPAPEDPAQTLNLGQADAELVRSQGGYINADEVTPAGG